MSDRDSFIDEVSEEVRRDRMFSLWKRFGPLVIAGIVAVVGGAGFVAWLDYKADQDAMSAGGALIAAADAPDDPVAALTALADQTDHEGAALLARLRAAAALAAGGDAAAAAAAYDAAAQAAADPALKEFAEFRAVMLRAPDMETDALLDQLAAFTAGGAYRLLALEAEGLAHARAGDFDAAEAALMEVVDDEATPPGLRQRVLALLTALGVEPDLAGESES